MTTVTTTDPQTPLAVRAPGFWRGLGQIAALELRQRLRSRTLLVLAIVWFCIIGAVTGTMWFILSLSSSTYGESFDAYPLFSIIVYFVLLFGTLVAPAISAGSISSERSGGTLATTQVTLVSTWSILLGKAVAAWATGLAFLVVASPFVILSLALGHANPLQLLIAILALALQIGVFTAFGVGLSALISSPLFAIVTAYLLVALLSIGTLIGFGLAAGASTRYVEVKYQTFSESYWQAFNACTGSEAEMLQCQKQVPVDCVTQTTTSSVTPTDRVWWILALNPYVVLGDMVSVRDAGHRTPEDLFGMVSYGVRSLQKRVDAPGDYSDCPAKPPYAGEPEANQQDELAGTIPVWWIGLGLQVIIAGGLLWGGYRRLDTPAARLPKGSRVA